METDTELGGEGSGETGGERSDTYSPLLARMLKIDPKAADVSLTALGRQAMGADTDEYKTARKEVDAARDAMLNSLQARKSGLDPSLLALAAGFLAPTRTGSFGESLSTALQGFSTAQQQQQQRASEMARMRYELARGTLAEQSAAAKLGLEVASKLTPQLTDLQKQVRAEGIDPTSPAGQARVKELTAQRTATPDMKEFAARYGMSITDPKFATSYQNFQRNKPLADIALRDNLDLTKPEDLLKAQNTLRAEKLRASKPELAKELEKFGGDILKEEDVRKAEQQLQRRSRREESPDIFKALETFGGSYDKPEDLQRAQNMVQATRMRTEKPDVAKALDSFGGSWNNPDDVKKAEAIVAQVMELDRKTKQAQLTRTNQEIAENVRSQNRVGMQNTAARVGVPLATTNKYAGMTPKEEMEARRADRAEAEKYITKNITPFITSIETDISQLQRALSINDQISTGVTYGIPVVGGVAKVLSGDRALINELDALSALAAKQNRIPGDSNVSNLDVKMMQLGTFSSDKEPSTNKVIIEFNLAQRQRDRDLNSFLTDYAAVNGTIDAEAMAQWRRYLNANPITSRDRTGKVIINKDRIPYQQFFVAPRVQVDAQGREVRQ